jgi:hypothetical protein
MQVYARYLCVALVFALALKLRAETATLTLADGQEFSADITDWNSQKVVVFADGQKREIIPQELLRIRFNSTDEGENEKESTCWIELADGSRFPFLEFSARDRIATVLSPLMDAEITFPVAAIRSVQFSPAGKAALEQPPLGATGDFLVIARKDSSETEILTGVIGDVTTEQVGFTWEGEAVPVKLSKVAALGFHQSERVVQPEPLCVLSLRSGASLHLHTISAESKELRVLTVAGVSLTLPLADVVEADYSIGKLTYLSDLELLSSKWTPLVALPAAVQSIEDFGTPRKDISFTGSPLTLSKNNQTGSGKSLQTFEKGLALRSRTELEYRLPKNMRRFVATAGIDPDTLEQGSVLLQIEIDGQTTYEQTIDGRQNPAEIDLDITGKQRLKIIVDYGDNLDTGDRLHLVEARLVK